MLACILPTGVCTPAAPLSTRGALFLPLSLTSLGALLVHDAVPALTALDGVLRLDQVVRATVCAGT